MQRKKKKMEKQRQQPQKSHQNEMATKKHTFRQ